MPHMMVKKGPLTPPPGLESSSGKSRKASDAALFPGGATLLKTILPVFIFMLARSLAPSANRNAADGDTGGFITPVYLPAALGPNKSCWS